MRIRKKKKHSSFEKITTFTVQTVRMKRKGSQAWIFLVFCLVQCLYTQILFAQRNTADASQRFSLKVNNMMDIGFENEGDQKTNAPQQNKLEDIFKGNEASYSFRLRTNEHFRLSINTSNNDSSGRADSLIQVNMIKGNDEDTSAYKDISKTPQTLYSGGNENTDQSFKIKYRAKPGATLPKDIQKLDLVYTASHP